LLLGLNPIRNNLTTLTEIQPSQEKSLLKQTMFTAV
jgi:hypothetical protein